MRKPAAHNGTRAVPPGPGRGGDAQDHTPVTLWDLEDEVYGLRASLLKARAIAVFARAADHEELQLHNEPDKNTLAHLMAVLIEQLDAAESVLDDYLQDERARRKGTTSP